MSVRVARTVGVALVSSVLSLSALCATPREAIAQSDSGRAQTIPPAGRGRAGGRQGLGRQGFGAGRQGQPPLDPAARQAAMRQIRQAMARRYRNQLNLNDDQLHTLLQTDQKYDRQRNQLQREERQTRFALRSAMQDTTGARDQNKIAQYIDQLAQSEHKKADLLDAEQKELSSFLTPMQRAQYLGLKEQMTKRIDQLNQQAPAAGAANRAAVKPDSTRPPLR